MGVTSENKTMKLAGLLRSAEHMGKWTQVSRRFLFYVMRHTRQLFLSKDPEPRISTLKNRHEITSAHERVCDRSNKCSMNFVLVALVVLACVVTNTSCNLFVSGAPQVPLLLAIAAAHAATKQNLVKSFFENRGRPNSALAARDTSAKILYSPWGSLLMFGHYSYTYMIIYIDSFERELLWETVTAISRDYASQR